MSQLGGPGARQANAKPIPCVRTSAFWFLLLSVVLSVAVFLWTTMVNASMSFQTTSSASRKSAASMMLSVAILPSLTWLVVWIGKISTWICHVHKVVNNHVDCRWLRRNLMAKDDFKNLGFGNDLMSDSKGGLARKQASGKDSQDKDGDARPGELRW
ncbi:cytochrome c oxidase assembly protein COX19 [Colletotrichum asianum]|uniref:Cytochrome c oxidase assembly protein COX19 n=1 Tax=Colletotrichum asianum TaxID=702518 RepID=A0A8H3ZJ09_9PEZI|nr:cytochrome c oxidase assembly protein COX19 [Colletotrichum asianum]